jgi:tetratricopeptide (TPR) repeat protein
MLEKRERRAPSFYFASSFAPSRFVFFPGNLCMSVERGSLLYQTGRHELAEQEFRAALGQDPSDALAHAMLGLCMSKRKEYAEATNEVGQAIRLRPDWHFGYAAMAQVMRDRDRPKEALTAINQAIQYDPFNAGHHAVQAYVLLSLRKWPDALSAADRGLEIAPDDAECLNARAMALVRLGRRDEAGATIQGALQRDPENATTHANQGWALLHAGDHKQALIHFREALRLEPEMPWAKSGLVEALKARNIIYRIMLRYFLLMSRLSRGAQWGVVIGGYLGYRGLKAVAETNPAVGRFIWPLLIAYIVFALMTWLSRPLFNLMLRLDRFGKYALSRDQVMGANCVGLTLLTAIVLAVAGFLTGSGLCLIAAGLSGFLMLPMSVIFSCTPGWPRLVMAGYVVVLVAIEAMLLAAFYCQTRHFENVLVGSIDSLLTAFAAGIFLNAWVANALIGVRVKR